MNLPDEEIARALVALNTLSPTKPYFTLTTRRHKGQWYTSHQKKVLREWYDSHDPPRGAYPTQWDYEKLARKTGLTLKQIANWFSNARRRIK